MDHFRTSRSRKVSTTPSTSSKGSLQKRFSGKHRKETAQLKHYTGSKTASSAAESFQSSASGIFEPTVLPITTNSWGLVRVYSGSLSPGTVYKTVLVNPQTTAKDVVAMVCKRLPRLPKGATANDFSLQEMQESSQGSYYRVLSNSECPLITQSKWEDPSTWSFRLSWRSNSVEKVQTRTAISKMDLQINEHFEKSMSPPEDLNPDNTPCGRPITVSGHSRGSLVPPQGLSQEQQQWYIEISQRVRSTEYQTPPVGNCKLQIQGDEEKKEEEEEDEKKQEEVEWDEEVIIIDMQEEEEEGRPIYQILPSSLEEEDSQANNLDLSFEKDTQQLAKGGKSSSPSRIIAGPNFNLSHANWNGLGDSQEAGGHKPTSAHRSISVKSSHTTVDSANLANESANCLPSTPYSSASLSKTDEVQEENNTPPKPSSAEQQLSSHPFVGRGLKTCVSCPSLQERWQVLGAEISAALQTGMSGVMQRVIHEGRHRSRKALVLPRRSHSMSSYSRKEWQQRSHVWPLHVPGRHPVILEDEASDEEVGVIKPSGELTGKTGGPASWREIDGEDAEDDANAEGYLDRGKAVVAVTEAEADWLEITDCEKERPNDESTNDAIWLEDSMFSWSAHDALSGSSCRTSSDIPLSTDEGISSPSPLLSSKSSTACGWQERMESKQESRESIEFEEEVVNVSFLDNSSESSGSSSGRSSPYINDHHHGNARDSHKTIDSRNGKVDGRLLTEGEDCVKRNNQGTTKTTLVDGKDNDYFMESNTLMNYGNDGSESQVVPFVRDVCTCLDTHQGQDVKPEDRMEQESLQYPFCQQVSKEMVHYSSKEGAVLEEEKEELKGVEEQDTQGESDSSFPDWKLAGKKVDLDCHTTEVSIEEHHGCTSSPSRQAHALSELTTVETMVLAPEDAERIDRQMTSIEDNVLRDTSLAPRLNGQSSLQCINIEAAGSANGNEGAGLSHTPQAEKEPKSHDTLKPKLEPVRFSSPNSLNLPLSKRDLDVDSDFLLWDGSDTGFIDDDDDLLSSTAISLGSQQKSPTTPPAMASPITPTGSMGLLFSEGFEQYDEETLLSEVGVIHPASGTDHCWEEEDEGGQIATACSENCRNESEGAISPEDVSLENLLPPEMVEMSLAESQSAHIHAGNRSGMGFLSSLVEEQMALSDLYVIREDPFMEDIEEREYLALHQNLWETLEGEEEDVEVRGREDEGSFWNGRSIAIEDSQSTTGRGLVHWRDNQESLQRLSDFLKIPPHLLAVEMPWINDPMESVRASVNNTINMNGGSNDAEDGDCSLMDDKESMDDALEEAMAMELDFEQSLPEDNSLSSNFPRKEFGSEDVHVHGEEVSCPIEHPLQTVPDDSFTYSNDLQSDLELRQGKASHDHMLNDKGTLELMQSASLEEPKMCTESSNAFTAAPPSDWELVTPQACHMLPQPQAKTNTSPTLSDSVLAHAVRPIVRDDTLWDVSVSAIKRKLMQSIGSDQSSPSPCPPPVIPYRTPPTTVDTSTCGLEQKRSCLKPAHIQSLDGGECQHLTC